MVTSLPAQLTSTEDDKGSLEAGRQADISVLKIETGRFKLSNNSSDAGTSAKLIRPAFCLRAGVRYDAGSVFVPGIATA